MEIPRSVQELSDMEVRFLKEAASVSATLEIEAAAFRARYAKLATAHETAVAELSKVRSQLSTARRHIDLATLPSALLPWVDSMATRLKEKPDDAESAALASLLNARRPAAFGAPPLLGNPALSGAEHRQAMSDMLKNSGANGWTPVDTPAADFTERAVVPYKTTEGSFAVRPALTDLAVVKCASVGGRALVAKRSYAPGDLIATEAPLFSYLTDAAALVASGALPPSLRRAVNEALFAPEGIAAMQAQKWDSRLALGVVSVLAEWTKRASEEHVAAQPTDEWSASSEDDDARPSSAKATVGGTVTSHSIRKLFFNLACPLQDLDTASMNSLAKFASFVSAALPPTYRVFDTTSEQTAAEHASMRRGMGEESVLSGHHRLSLAIAKAKERAAAATEASSAQLEDPSDCLAMAPYDDNPLHRPVLISPLVGPVLPDKATQKGDATAPSTEAFPPWVRVSIEDVARIMLILQCNAVSDAGTAAAGRLTALALCSASQPPVPTVESLHLAWLLAGIEHSCRPNAIVVPHHLLTAKSAMDSFGEWATTASSAETTPAWCQGPLLFELRAIQPIEAGERLSIAYTAPHVPRAQRLQKLRRQYYFDCQCASSCGAEGVDWTRAQLSRSNNVVWMPPASVQSGGWWPVLADSEVDARLIAALKESDEPALLMARREAAWGVIASDDTDAEALALLALLTDSHADFTPCGALHFAVVLRFLRLASSFVASEVRRQQDAFSLAAPDHALRCAKAVLLCLRDALRDDAHKRRRAALDALLEVMGEPDRSGETLGPQSLPRFSRFKGTEALVEDATLATAPVLLDAVGAIVAVRCPKGKRADAWRALRDALELFSPSPNWAPLVRCAAAAVDPSGETVPLHLKRI